MHYKVHLITLKNKKKGVLGNKRVTNAHGIKQIFRQIEAPALSDKINVDSNVDIKNNSEKENDNISN